MRSRVNVFKVRFEDFDQTAYIIEVHLIHKIQKEDIISLLISAYHILVINK